jgi:hypothetical protein
MSLSVLFRNCSSIECHLQKSHILDEVNLLQNRYRITGLTISPQSHLHEALTTADSFLEHNKDIDYTILVTDQEDFTELQKFYPSISFKSVNALNYEILNEISEIYTELEFAYALTPFVIQHLLEKSYDQVLFLKLETLVLGKLDPLFIELNHRSAIVTPHLLFPDISVTKINQEVDVLMAGVFNGGIVGFRNTTEALEYLNWWGQKTKSQCFRDISNGLHFEQRWLDFITSFIIDLGVIRNVGINVAHWNLDERKLKVVNGLLYAGEDKCLVFRFSGYDENNSKNLSIHKADISEQNIGAAVYPFDKYKKELRRHKVLLGTLGG